MEQQKLRNVTTALILGIVSFICCCFGGIPGAILSAIGFFLLRGDEKKYREQPELYSNYSTLKTAKIITIIGMIVGILYFFYTLYSISQMGGWEGYMERVQEMKNQFGVQ